MRIPFAEPTAPRYIYVDPEANQVHLLVPIVGGQDISTDNTCKSTVAMDAFFQEDGALRELNAYKAALEFDLQWLDSGHPQKALKESRLNQINAYIAAMPAMKTQYKIAISSLLATPSNLYSIQLRPKELDNQSRVINPVFSLNRGVYQGETLSALYNALHQALPHAISAPVDPRSRLNDTVIKALPENADFKIIQNTLTEQCIALWGIVVDFESADMPDPLNRSKKIKVTVDQPFMDNLMGNSNENPGTAEEYIHALLNTCAPSLWYSFPISPFYSEQGNTDRTERLSIATQFFLAHVNTYCAAHGMSRQNFGTVFDHSSDLSDEVAGLIISALAKGIDVEDSLCEWINEHATDFDLNPPLNSADIQHIKDNFTRNYRTVTATKENPHMDDFMILETQAPTGLFVKHQGHICVDSSALTNPVLTNTWNQQHYELSGTNEHIKADGLELSMDELLSCIEDDSQFEKLPMKIQLECLKSPAFQLSTFLHDVAKGKQDEAEKLLTNQPEKTQVLLTSIGTFTDYSGRTFTCTAYEYAYWAKDKHMCRMLESVMDSETKAVMLERIDALALNGLTYTQHAQEITGSKGFNLDPLKTAYEEYIRIWTAWEQTDYDREGEAALIAAWMNVGIAQRDLPVHYVNEYFRKDRSFKPLPTFDEPSLPRELKFYNHNTGDESSLFPLVLTASSGLGVDFAFSRAGQNSWGMGGEAPLLLAHADWTRIDLAAVSHLDVVRTEDLKQSHKNLEPAVPGLGMI